MRRVMLVAVLLVGCGKKEEGGTPRPPVDRPPTTENPAASVGASAVWHEYGQDAAAADGKYTGKVVAVKGNVHTVLDDGDGWTLNLFANPEDSNRQPPGTFVASGTSPARTVRPARCSVPAAAAIRGTASRRARV